MIPLDKARKKLLSGIKPLGTETVPVLKSIGRVIREDIRTPHSIPPFSKSAMDGYAVRSADVADASANNPVELKVLEDIPAGKVGRRAVGKGAASRIMTGAPMPRGADAVVMVEYTESTEGGVRIMTAVQRGEHVAPAGEDVKKGQTVIKAGTLIGAAQMGMIASTGRTRVDVTRRPRVAVLSTGSEIAAPGKVLGRGQIFDSNGYSLTGMAVSRGAEAKFLGIAGDRKGALERKIDAARDFDILVLSGGVSVGDYDLVQDVLLENGVRRIFWRAAIKPGKPTFAGKRGKQYVFGLPGNPVSCMVTFELFVRPALETMLGRSEIGPRKGKALLAGDLRIKPNRRKFLRGKLVEEGATRKVELFKSQESGVLRSMLASDVLVDVPAGVTRLPAGTEVDILYLE